MQLFLQLVSEHATRLNYIIMTMALRAGGKKTKNSALMCLNGSFKNAKNPPREVTLKRN
jgi:hypothetical protein